VRIEPGSGQESVWDYPRPPIVVPCEHRIRVEVGGLVVADSIRAVRVLETSQAPAYYLPPDDVAMELLEPSPTRTFCEWKGQAGYWTVRAGDVVSPDAAWSYPDPVERFTAIRDHFAFYAQRVDRAWVGDELVSANDGDFYGGWITSHVVGPFKGGAGTLGW
jgi:uncharacterized protein (DUF427 family)